MRAVNHHDFPLALFPQHLPRSFDALGIEIRAFAPTSQDHEAVLVAACARNGRQALFRHAHEMMSRRRGTHPINSDAQAAIRAVLEADGEGQAARQLAMQLALGGARADGAEGDGVGEELRGDGVEHLAGDGHAGAGEVAVELAGDAQALVDLEGLVDLGVVDQPLPADGGAGLLEVGAHDDEDVGGEAGC